MYPPHNVHYNDRAARRALRRAKEDLERELAKFPAEDDDDDDEDDDRDETVQQWALEQAVHEDQRMMPLGFLAELSGESQKTDVEPDFDFTPARRRNCSLELPAAVPAELPTNIHWTDATDWTDSASIGVALTTAGRVRTPPHARPFSLPTLEKARASDNLRQLARKSIGSPVRRRHGLPYPQPLLLSALPSASLYSLDAASSSSAISISSTLSTGTATVQAMAPSVPTLITIKPARRRPGPRLVNGSAVPPCLEVGRQPSYRDSAARAHAVPTRRSLPPAPPPAHPFQITPAWVPRPFVLSSLTIPETPTTPITPPPRNWKRYSDLAQYTRPLPTPERETNEARMREVRQRIASRLVGGSAPPTTFDEILARPPMPTLRRSPTSVAYASSAGAAAQFLLSPAACADSTSTTTAYDSLDGRQLLHTLRLFLGIADAWSPAQTLVFVLEHTRTRSLAISRGSDTVRRMNALSWTGVLRFIRGYKECERVARWLYSREALFTNKTSVRSLLLRKAKKRVYVENDSRAGSGNSSSSTDSICIPTMLSQWAIENNPRRRYHQGWTGAGRSRLSTCILAE